MMYLDFKGEIYKTSQEENNSLMICFKSPSISLFYIPMAIISTVILIIG